jgi:hypothetical protein
MADDNNQLIQLMHDAFDALRVKVLAALSRKPDTAGLADNSKLIGTDTATTLINAGKLVGTNHVADRNNPHGITADSLDGVDNDTVDAVLGIAIPRGALPISRYGDFAGSALPISFAGWTISFTAQVPSMMAGYDLPAPIASINLATLATDVSNRTLFVYLRFDGVAIKYLVSLTALAETSGKMYIGKIVTGDSNISSVSIQRVTRIDTYRVSTTPVGSAIPATTSTPDLMAQLNPAWIP